MRRKLILNIPNPVWGLKSKKRIKLLSDKWCQDIFIRDRIPLSGQFKRSPWPDVFRQIQKFVLIGEQVTEPFLDDLCARKGFSAEIYNYIVQFLKYVGLGECLFQKTITTLFVKTEYSKFFCAVKSCDEVFFRARCETVLHLREVETSYLVDTVYIDLGCEPELVHAACLVFGWVAINPSKYPTIIAKIEGAVNSDSSNPIHDENQ